MDKKNRANANRQGFSCSSRRSLYSPSIQSLVLTIRADIELVWSRYGGDTEIPLRYLGDTSEMLRRYHRVGIELV